MIILKFLFCQVTSQAQFREVFGLGYSRFITLQRIHYISYFKHTEVENKLDQNQSKFFPQFNHNRNIQHQHIRKPPDKTETKRLNIKYSC